MTTYLVTVDIHHDAIRVEATKAATVSGRILDLLKDGEVVASFSCWLYYTTEGATPPALAVRWRHANSCSNQNALSPTGAYDGAAKCGCAAVAEAADPESFAELRKRAQGVL